MKIGDLVLFEDGNTAIVIKEPVMKKFVGPVVKLLYIGDSLRGKFWLKIFE